MKLPPLYWVEWMDATSLSGWNEMEDAHASNSPVHIVTVGFLISWTKKSILLSQGVSEDGGWLNGNTIPTAWIVKKRKLK